MVQWSETAERVKVKMRESDEETIASLHKTSTANGVHVIEIYNGRNYLTINIPISIIGESREHCIVMGGLVMQGNEEDDINVSNLTLRDSKYHGVCHGWNGVSVVLFNLAENFNFQPSKKKSVDTFL